MQSFNLCSRTWGVIKEPRLMNESLRKAEALMSRYGYTKQEIEIVKQIILPHSCRGKNQPKTKEGKAMATADALAHLMTDYYAIFGFNRWKDDAKDFEEYRAWVLEKIDRDFHKKIFYDEYKKLAQKRYEALKTVFTVQIR